MRFFLLTYFISISVLAWFAVPACADRIYSLNNYPTEQDGGTLMGSITVVDTAPDDGILEQAEVLAWNWSATNGPLHFTANSTEENAFFGTEGSASITETNILLAGPGSFFLGAENSERTVLLDYIRPAASSPQYYASQDFLDLLQFAWFTFPANDALGGDPWVIATLVPEPASITLITSAGLAIGVALARRGRRRRHEPEAASERV
jgi:hypothetical protein